MELTLTGLHHRSGPSKKLRRFSRSLAPVHRPQATPGRQACCELLFLLLAALHPRFSPHPQRVVRSPARTCVRCARPVGPEGSMLQAASPNRVRSCVFSFQHAACSRATGLDQASRLARARQPLPRWDGSPHESLMAAQATLTTYGPLPRDRQFNASFPWVDFHPLCEPVARAPSAPLVARTLEDM